MWKTQKLETSSLASRGTLAPAALGVQRSWPHKPERDLGVILSTSALTTVMTASEPLSSLCCEEGVTWALEAQSQTPLPVPLWPQADGGHLQGWLQPTVPVPPDVRPEAPPPDTSWGTAPGFAEPHSKVSVETEALERPQQNLS